MSVLVTRFKLLNFYLSIFEEREPRRAHPLKMSTQTTSKVYVITTEVIRDVKKGRETRTPPVLKYIVQVDLTSKTFLSAEIFQLLTL